MEPAFFVIAILGCGEAEAPCVQLRQLDTRYESQAACTRATDDALAANSEGDYPVIVAQCVSPGQAALLRPAEIRLPAPAQGHKPQPPMKPRRG